MMAKLKENTVVIGEDGAPRPLLAGDDVPKWAVKQVGDHLFVEEAKASGRKASEPDGSLPPKSGNGSSAANWLAYARAEENAAKLAAAEIVIPDDAKQSEIIAALEKAEIPTEKQQA